MSLRVLLADESDTIKKVFQLALQDMNAEIKSVHSGLDVLDVAQTFKPEVIFTDVLLQKKNGYDTCYEIKQHAVLGKTPVVLMWSSFMELDQEQYKKSKADAQLEKPFDADVLRDLIKKFVPKTAENPMSQFLNFPKSIAKDMKETKPAKGAAKAPAAPLKESAQKEDTSEFNIGSILGEVTSDERSDETPPSFDAVEISTGDQSIDETWRSQDLNKFKIDAPVSDNLDKFEALNLGQAAPDDDENTADISLPPLGGGPGLAPTEEALTLGEPFTSPYNSRTQTNTGNRRVSTTTGMSESEIEAIVRAHTEEVIKSQVKDSLLSIIEKVVREELNKVLEEEIRLKQEFNSDSP